MIHYTCPRCKAKMQSPDSLAGMIEQCPGCRYGVTVPPVASSAPTRAPAPPPPTLSGGQSDPEVPKAVLAAVGFVGRLWVFCRRRRKLLAIIGVNVLILTGVLGWLLPDWLPRPVVTIATPSRGRFPPRAELTQVLAEHGYHAFAAEPVPDILRARRLLKYTYVCNANFAAQTAVNVWCPLDDRETPIAVSSYANEAAFSAAKKAADIDLVSDSAADKMRAALVAHALGLNRLMKALCGVAPTEAKYVATERDRGESGEGTAIHKWSVARNRGFELENVRVVRAVGARITEDGHLLVLKDSSWPTSR